MTKKLDRERQPMQVIIPKKHYNCNRPLSFLKLLSYLKLTFPLAVHSIRVWTVLEKQDWKISNKKYRSTPINVLNAPLLGEREWKRGSMKLQFVFTISLRNIYCYTPSCGRSALPPLYRMGFLPPLKQPLIQGPIFYADQLQPHCREKGLQTEK